MRQNCSLFLLNEFWNDHLLESTGESTDFKTMQSKASPNIYFAEEAMDIDGVRGDYNFQAAWKNAYVAGKSL
jgi:predicted flavoprotein YhiN